MDDARATRLVSIVIPVYNGAAYLRAAIDSALAQTWPDIEIIVVDDGSNDDGRTRAVADSFGDRIRVVTKPNEGVGSALNAGIAAARGSWFSWLSHDDLYHPTKIEKQMRVLLAEAPGTFCFSDYDLIDAGGRFIERVHATRGYEPDKPLWALFESRINGCSVIAPLAIMRNAGGFSTALPSTQDYELWFRLVRRHRLIAIPGALVSYRQHDAQGSRGARHFDEAGLLWAEMLGSLTPAEMILHGGTEVGFLERAGRALWSGVYPGALAAIDRMLIPRLREWPISVVWAGDGAAGPAALLGILAEAGLSVADCVVADCSADAGDALALRRAAGPTLQVLRPHATTGLSSILELALAAGAGRVVLLADRLTSLDAAAARRGLMSLATGQSDGWLQAQGGSPPGPLPAAFRGAMIARATAAAALERCRALGAGDAVRTLGLVGRLACAPETPPAANVNVNVNEAANDAPAPLPAPPEDAGKWIGYRPALAATAAGAMLLVAANWLHHRVPITRGRVGPAIGRVLGAGGLVDGNAYLAANADVRAAGIDPVIHYLRHGWRARLDPRPQPTRSAQAAVASPAKSATSAPAKNPAGTLGAAASPPPADAPAHLLIVHTLGGGTLRYAEIVAAHLARRGKRVVYAWGTANRHIAVAATAHGGEDARFPLPHGIENAVAHLRGLGVERVDVIHALGLENHIEALLTGLGVPYDVTLTDYFLVATSPHLIDAAGQAAAATDAPDALAAFRRSAPHPVLAGAARRLACSRDLAARIEALAPGIGVVAVSPPEPLRPEAFRVTPPAPIAADEPLRVLLIGSLTAYKGGDKVIAAARLAGQRKLPIEFHVFGSASPPVPLAAQREGSLALYGRFADRDLARLVCGVAPHLAWFPAEAQETYGFALSEAMLMGLPILARGMGAYSERLAGRAFTWVVPKSEDASAEAWLARLMALRENGLGCPTPPPEPGGLPPIDTRFYAERY